jgi:hypothetical protein
LNHAVLDLVSGGGSSGISFDSFCFNFRLF